MEMYENIRMAGTELVIFVIGYLYSGNIKVMDDIIVLFDYFR